VYLAQMNNHEIVPDRSPSATSYSFDNYL
jgi:hypothetical protein